MEDIAIRLAISVPTLHKAFDKLLVSFTIPPAPKEAINMLIDATFFGRKFGYLCFHDKSKIIYLHEIKTENVNALREGLFAVKNAGYHFASFTLDGKRGFIHTIKKLFPNALVQMCHFHQKAIIRRYITDNPKSECGQELKQLMHLLSDAEPQIFIDRFFALKEKYFLFLNERNAQGEFIHMKLRAAFRSIKTNLPYLFIYRETRLTIPNTTNRLEGVFSHLKEKIKIHRGLTEKRKKQAIVFCLTNQK